MKIAREIALRWYSKSGIVGVRDTTDCEGLEALIAAKLEPVGKAVREYKSVMDSEVYDVLKIPAAKVKLEAVLGLFEEE